jgi:hypothetical protein
LISRVDSRPWHRWKFSTFLAHALAAKGILYGRVALDFGCGICASATLSIPDVLLPMATEFGWSVICRVHAGKRAGMV